MIVDVEVDLYHMELRDNFGFKQKDKEKLDVIIKIQTQMISHFDDIYLQII